MKVTVFDYGAGNLHSLLKALAGDGRRVEPQGDPAIAARMSASPGAMRAAACPNAPTPGSTRTSVRAALADGLPCLGICLGMQLLFDGSDEGPGDGIGMFPGRVRKLEGERVPQIGWNTIENANDPLFDAAHVTIAYYANSYVCRPDDSSCVRAWSTHGSTRFPAFVRAGRAVGVQFHPEKSSRSGVEFIRAFLREVRT